MEIKDTILKFLHLDTLVSNVTGYIESRLELYKLEVRADMTKVLSRAMVYGVMGLIGLLFLIFLSIGLAHFINSYAQAVYVGYWVVAGIYGVALLVLLIFRKTIEKNAEIRFGEITKRKVK